MDIDLLTRLNIVIQQRNRFLDENVLLQEQIEHLQNQIRSLNPVDSSNLIGGNDTIDKGNSSS